MNEQVDRDVALRWRRALAELVALNDIKQRLPAWPFPNDPDADLRADYARRKPLAWAAARTALQSGAPEVDEAAAFMAGFLP